MFSKQVLAEIDYLAAATSSFSERLLEDRVEVFYLFAG